MNKEYLLRGDSLKFNKGLEIKQPTINDVMSIGFGEYSWFINCLCNTVSDVIIPLWGKGIDYETITNSELFFISIKGHEELFCKIFKYFTNAENIVIYNKENEPKEFLLVYKDIPFLIKDDSMEYIINFFSSIHKIEHKPMRKFAGEKTKKSILDEDYDEYLMLIKEQENKPFDTFGNLLSDLVVLGHREWDYVYSLTMARLYEEIYKINKKQKIDLTLHGIYSGFLDGKKIPSKDLELN